MKKLTNVTENKLREMAGNTVFSANIVKKDGSKRVMSARFDVKKHLKGGASTTAHISSLATVFDMNAKGYRSINLNTVEGFKIKGEEWEVVK